MSRCRPLPRHDRPIWSHVSGPRRKGICLSRRPRMRYAAGSTTCATSTAALQIGVGKLTRTSHGPTRVEDVAVLLVEVGDLRVDLLWGVLEVGKVTLDVCDDLWAPAIRQECLVARALQEADHFCGVLFCGTEELAAAGRQLVVVLRAKRGARDR